MVKNSTSTFLNSQAVLKIKALLRSYPTSERYLVGVSAGRDSVALLRLLLSLGYQNLIVCHLNHSLRNKESSADAQFVKRLAVRWKLEYFIERSNVKNLAITNQSSIETAAREARFEFFSEIAVKTNCDTIFLGHHANDQIETFLFRLFRGSGSLGLSGMKVTSKRLLPNIPKTSPKKYLYVVRPLLSLWREDIDMYLTSLRQKFREDSSNIDLAYTRNRMRLEIIPALEKSFGREIRSTLWRTANILSDEEEWLDALCQSEVEQFGDSLPSKLPTSFLKNHPVAKQRRLIRIWLQTQNITNIGYREVEEIRSLIDPKKGYPSKVNLPNNQYAQRRDKHLFITKSTA